MMSAVELRMKSGIENISQSTSVQKTFLSGLAAQTSAINATFLRQISAQSSPGFLAISRKS